MWEIAASYELNPDLKSRTIDKASNCGFTHMLLIYTDKDTSLQTIWHATGAGLHSLRGEALLEFFGKHGFFARFPIEVKNNDFALGFCRGNEGKDYSESQLAAIVVPGLRKHFGDGNRELICCEFVLRFCMEKEICGLKIEQDPDFVNLGDALRLVMPLNTLMKAA